MRLVLRSLRYTTTPPADRANASSGVADGVAHPMRTSTPGRKQNLHYRCPSSAPRLLVVEWPRLTSGTPLDLIYGLSRAYQAKSVKTIAPIAQMSARYRARPS